MSISFRIANTADGTQRDFLWQYDKNQRVYIDGAIFADGGETVLVPEFVIFSTRERDDAYQVTTQVDSEGKAYAVIPDSVLRDGAKLLVYAYDVVPESGTQEVIAHATFAVKRRNEETELTPTEEQTIDIEQLLAECRSLKQSVVSLVGQPSDSGSTTLMGQMNDHEDDLETELETVLRGVITNSIVPEAESALQSYVDSVSKPALDDHVGSADDDATDGTLMGLLNARIGSPADPVEADTINGHLNARLVQLESDLEAKETSLEGTLDNYVNIKKGELDTYVGADSSSGLKKELSDFTDAQKPEIDSYVNSTSKPALDSYTATKKAELDSYTITKETQLDAKEAQLESALASYEQSKETELDTYTGTKKTELDSYVNSTTKPAIDAYEQTKETELDAYTEEKKAEVQAVYAEDLGNVSSRVQSNSKRIANLEDKSAPYTIEYPNTDYGKGDIPASIEKGAVVKSVDGNTRRWNQLLNYTNFPATTTINDVTFTNNGDGSITVNGTASADATLNLLYFPNTAGNYYFYHGCPSDGSPSTFYLGSNTGTLVDSGSGQVRSISTVQNTRLQIVVKSGVTVTNKVFWPQINDLTLIFGAGNEPSTVADAIAQIPALGRFNAFDAGSLVKLKVGGFRAKSRNLFDGVTESGYWNTSTGQPAGSTDYIRAKNAIPVEPSTKYCFTCLYAKTFVILWYDLSDHIISWAPSADNGEVYTTRTSPSSARFMRFFFPSSYGTTYRWDTCINVSDGLDGTYTPFDTKTVEFSSPVELGKAGSVRDRLDTLGNTVKRNVAEVDLSTLSWTNVTGTLYSATLAGVKGASSSDVVGDMSCDKYIPSYASFLSQRAGMIAVSDNEIRVNTGSSSTPSGTLTYALASPTTEPISVPSAIEVEPYGTIELIQVQDVEIDTEFSVQYIPDSQYLTKSMVVDNLSSESTDVPLSANQGRILGGLVSKAFKAIANLIQRVGTFLVQYPDSIYGRGEVPAGMAKFAEVSCLRGVSRVGNNIITNGNFESVSGWSFAFGVSGSFSVADNIAKIIFGNNNSIFQIYKAGSYLGFSYTSGHSYLVFVKVRLSVNASVRVIQYETNNIHYGSNITVSANQWTLVPILFTAGASGQFETNVQSISGMSQGDVIEAKEFVVTDLTLYFGGNIPSDAQTIADIQQNYPELLVPRDYNAGEIVDATYSGVRAWKPQFENKTVSSGTESASTSRVLSDFIAVEPSTLYPFALQYEASGQQIFEIHRYDANKAWLSQLTVNATSVNMTTPSTCAFVKVLLRYSDNRTTTPSDWNGKLVFNSAVYEGTVLGTLTLPSPVTLRSAGSVADTDELCVEVSEGVFKRRQTVRVGQVDLGTLNNWGMPSSSVFRNASLNTIALNAEVLCEKYIQVASYPLMLNTDKSIWVGDVTKEIYIHDSAYSDATAFKASLVGKTLYYALADPVVTLTDPILDNFVLTEAGGTITPRQTQTKKIDARFDMNYMAL